MAVAVCFVLSFIFPALFLASKLLLLILLLAMLLDIFLLYRQKAGLIAERILPEKLSNGDQNQILVVLDSRYPFPLRLQVIDEVPFQFQLREWVQRLSIPALATEQLRYELRPTERGQYFFGKLNVYASSGLGLIARRYISGDKAMLPCYPSFLQMRKYELMAFSQRLNMYGLRKIRRLGHTTDFEQIKEYALGDDIRAINWRATAKRQTLMVNQYQDEKAQPVYNVIDKGRLMQMPFQGLSLLDYAINASLVLSNIVLRKEDKAGVLTFSTRIQDLVVAERRAIQMQLIMDALYHVSTDYLEADFGRLYSMLRYKVKNRSLLLLYTNFETMDSLRRQLPYLLAMNKNHLVVVIFFKNTELYTLLESKAQDLRQVYDKVIAAQFDYEKRMIVNELRKYGIHSVLTSPQDLTADTINKYLELKARGLF